MSVSIRVSLVKPSETQKVLDFVQERYQREYGISPDDLLQVCFAAWKEETLLGAISLEFQQGQNLFELEKLLDFNPVYLLTQPRDEMVNFGRWASIDDIASRALAFRAVQFSMNQGKSVAIAVSKPRVLSYLKKKYSLKFNLFHVKMREVPGVKFFRQGVKPIVYAWQLSDWAEALAKEISPIINFE